MNYFNRLYFKHTHIHTYARVHFILWLL